MSRPVYEVVGVPRDFAYDGDDKICPHCKRAGNIDVVETMDHKLKQKYKAYKIEFLICQPPVGCGRKPDDALFVFRH